MPKKSTKQVAVADCTNCVNQSSIDKMKDDIADLKSDGREYKVEIKNLCSKVESLVTTLRWGIALLASTTLSLVGIFINIMLKK